MSSSFSKTTARLCERAPLRQFRASECLDLLFYLTLYFCGLGFAVGHQHHLAVAPVLRLGQQVRRDEGGVGLLVGDDHDFRRPRRHINRDDGRAEQLFGRGDIAVARAEDFVHFRDGFGAVGHRRHRLGPADAENPVDAAEMRCVQHGRGDFSVFPRGGAKDNLRASGDFRRQREHQYRREEGSGAPGDVEPHAADRHRLLDAAYARRRLYFEHHGLRLQGPRG